MSVHRLAGCVAAWSLVAACADSDNPAALASLDPAVRFDLDAERPETLEEIELRVDVLHAGSHLAMSTVELEVEHLDDGSQQSIVMEPDGDLHTTHLIFWEPGEYHLRLMGRPEGHHLLMPLAEHELNVVRRHEVLGPYWVELAVEPGPVPVGAQAHLELFVFSLMDQEPGDPVQGLTVTASVHSPLEVESSLAFEEEGEGEYSAEYLFEEEGEYELEAEIEDASVTYEAHFHIPVGTVAADGADEHGHGGGHGS